MIKTAIIKKLPNGKYRLYSRKKGPGGQRKNLGTYDSLKAVQDREKAVQYFKHNADDLAQDKETEALESVSKAARYLEEAGMVEKAQLLYNIMDAIDGNLEANAADFIPDAQKNTENMGYLGGDGIGGGYSMLNVMAKLIRIANKLDKNGHINEANKLDTIIAEQTNMFQKSILFEQLEGKKPKIEVSYVRNQDGKNISEQKKFDSLDAALKYFQEMQEDDSIDDLVFNAGKTNITQLEMPGSGGLSDWYFYNNPYSGEPVRGL